jgi:hypothetical protein
MKSKLNITEFRNRIKENSIIGSPKLKLSPFGIFTMFGGTSKTFYGNFDDSTFRFTMNSTILPTFYILKGKYKNTNNTLNVNYTIEPNSKFQIVWMKFFPIISLFAFNLFFLLSSRKTPFEVYIAFNSFIVFIIFFSRWVIKRKKKNLEQKFIETFELII